MQKRNQETCQTKTTRKLSFTAIVLTLLALCAPAFAQELNWQMTSWIMHDGQGILPSNITTDVHGDSQFYALAKIPAPDDAGWRSPNADELKDGNIWYNKVSTVECFKQVDFTYLQTSIFVPAGAQIEQFEVKFDNVDDGVRAHVTNSQHFEIFDPAADFRLGQSNQTGDLSQFIVAGETNWIDLIQVDDCAGGNNLENARLAVKLVGGTSLEVEPAKDVDVIRTPWILHEGGLEANSTNSIVTLPSPVPSHGDASLYNYMAIPAENDAGWRVPTSDETDAAGDIVYTKTSNLTSCFNQADFTYVQSIIHVPAGVTPSSVTVGFDKVDDGARVYVNGQAAAGTDIVLGAAPQTGNLSSLLVEGNNRIVIVQVDDCPTENNLINAQIFIDGNPIKIGAP